MRKDEVGIAPIGGKGAKEDSLMVSANITLDPSKTGSEAARLETNLRGLVIGQEEAIEQVVNVYQASCGESPRVDKD
jgi:hypothetical protein